LVLQRLLARGDNFNCIAAPHELSCLPDLGPSMIS
jgi:hypothetical protein